MPRRVVEGVVVSDKAAKTRRVEIARLVTHAKYGTILRRKTLVLTKAAVAALEERFAGATNGTKARAEDKQ